MEHLVLFGPQDAQEQWQRIGAMGKSELVCLLADGPRQFPDEPLESVGPGVVNDIRQSGGMAFFIATRAQRTEVHVVLKKDKRFQAPSQLLIVGLDGRHELRKIGDDAQLELTKGQCMVVPANASAEKKLIPFIESLWDLPADYRTAMIFNLIVPTIESRVARLEQIEPLARWGEVGTPDGQRGRRWGLIRDVLLLGMIVPLLIGVVLLYMSVASVEELLDPQRQASGNGPEAPETSPAPQSDARRENNAGGEPTEGRSFDETVARFFASDASVSEAILMNGVKFQGGKLTPSETATAQIRLVGAVLKSHPMARIEILGHSDNQGADERKLQISQERADEIRMALVDLGIEGGRVRAVGRADSLPLPGEAPDSPKNRRVELRFRR